MGEVLEKTCNELGIEKIGTLTERCPDCNRPVSYIESQPICENENCERYTIPYER